MCALTRGLISLLSQYCLPPVVKMRYKGHMTFLIVLLSHMLHQVSGLELGRFLSDNGMKFVTLMQNKSYAGEDLKKLSYQLVKGHLIFIRHHQMSDKYINEMHQMNVDCQVILFDLKKDDLQLVMGLVSETKVARSILLLKDPWTADEEQKMTNILATHGKNSFFYISVPLTSNSQRSFSWFQIITTISGYSKSELLFWGNTMKIEEDFDLQGLRLNSISVVRLLNKCY